MGTSTSSTQFVGKINQYARSIPAAQRSGVAAAALTTKTSVLGFVGPATGGDFRLSGVGKNGARLGVSYRISGGANPTALVKATGPMQLVENDIAPHLIVPKGSQGVRANKKRGTTRVSRLARVAGGDVSGVRGVLKFKNGQFARYAVKAGGSKGRHPWERGVKVARPKSGEAYRKAHRAALARTFGGIG